ncbi:hypothetical protein [Thermoflexus hugenholtzii]
MFRRLISRENDAARVMDKSILQQLGIPPDSPVKLWADAQSWIVRPVRSLSKERQETFERALREANEEWGEMLQRLAER